jgi:quercetin dioxygenase-like cupin family protein
VQIEFSRPFRPIELGAETLAFFSLPALAADLANEDEYARAGVSAITLARDEHVTLVLVALRAGAVMREHRAPSAATVVVLSGCVEFTGGDAGSATLQPRSAASFSADVAHAVEAREDAAYLVIIGGRNRPRAATLAASTAQ